MPRISVLRALAALATLALLVLVVGCGSRPPREAGAPPRHDKPADRGERAPVEAQVLGRDDDLLVIAAGQNDDAVSLARHYLNDADKAWWIAQLNGNGPIAPGHDVLIPLRAPDPLGLRSERMQLVPVLCYHRFGARSSKMSVTAPAFAAQLAYLADNGYRVIRLRDLADFLDGKAALPPKSVALTIDDGYRSAYQVAWPLLKKYGFPATVFLYTDFVGAGDALTWEQMREMVASGLIDIQPHSKTHSNLAMRASSESDAAYRERVRLEIEASQRAIKERLGVATHSFAYPYGDVNEVVADQIARSGGTLGLTVTPGGNAFFAPPLMLRRTMIFGDDDIAAFKAKLGAAPVYADAATGGGDRLARRQILAERHWAAGRLIDAELQWHALTLLAPQDEGFRRARATARAAIARSAEVSIDKARLAMQKGDNDGAIAYFVHALRMAPDNAQAQRALRELERRRMVRLQASHLARAKASAAMLDAANATTKIDELTGASGAR